MADEQAIDMLPRDEVEMAKKRAVAAKRMLSVLGHCTHPGDWVKMGQAYYLTANGADRMARVVGLTVEVLDVVPQPEETPEGEIDVTYVARCRVTMPDGNSVTEIGTRSLSDDFFSHRGKVPLSQVSRGDVMRAATTNARARAIKSALGIGGIPPSIMAESGMDLSKVAEVAFDGEKPAAPTDEANALRSILSPITTNPAEQDRIILLVGSFVGRNGEIIRPNSVGQITNSPKRLEITKKHLERIAKEMTESTTVDIIAFLNASLEDAADKKRREAVNDNAEGSGY